MALTFDFVQQILIILAFFAGLALGEAVVSRAFGRPKRAMLALVEVLVFAVGLVVWSSVFYATLEFNLLLITNFGVAFVLAVAARAISTGLGFAAEAAGRGSLNEYSREERLLIASARALAEHGVEEPEIVKALCSAGFSKASVQRVFSTHKIVSKPHALLREVARLEQEIVELKKKRK